MIGTTTQPSPKGTPRVGEIARNLGRSAMRILSSDHGAESC